MKILGEHLEFGAYIATVKESDFNFHEIEGVKIAVADKNFTLNAKTQKLKTSSKLSANGKRMYVEFDSIWIPCGFDYALNSLSDRLLTADALNNTRLIDRIKDGLKNPSAIKTLISISKII